MNRPFRILIALLLLTPVNRCFAGEGFGFPASRAGHIAAAFFQAFNAGEDSMRSFIAEYRDQGSLNRTPLEQRVEQYVGIRELLGDLAPHSITSDDPLSILAHASAAQGYVEIGFEVQTSAPFKLTMMSIRPAERPADAASRFEAWTTLEELLQQAREQAELPAIAAAMVVEGKIVAVSAVGVRAKGATQSVALDDRFHIGSVTKSLTATLLADLVEGGILRWDLTVGEAVPDLPMRKDYAEVTLRQLVDHQGGIQPYLTFSAEDIARLSALPGRSTEIRGKFLAEVLQQPPISDPGTAMHYSNAGFALAGYVAEMTTGKSWEQLLQERVFEPLHLDSAVTGWPATVDRPDQPRGHFAEGTQLRVQGLDEYEVGAYLAPAGDVSMSVTDLARYAAMHAEGLAGHDGAVLTAESIRDLHTTSFADTGDHYAGGWVVDETSEGLERHWHNGSAGTFFAMVQILPSARRAAVILMNSGNMTNNSLCMELAREMFARF